MNYSKKILSSFIIISNLFAGIISVPGDQPNIQAGINWASSGDTVLVASGTYSGSGNYDINFYGKGLHLLSESGPDNTTIDLNYDNRGFFFDSGEDTTTIIEGFNLYEGYVCREDSYFEDDYHNGYGGAVYINDASPKFINMHFKNNDAKYKGSAVYIEDGGNAIFEDCYFQDNEYNYENNNEGGAVAIYNADATFSNCTFHSNGSDSGYRGGAIWIKTENEDNQYSVNIDSCNFTENGTDSDNSYGGAIWVHDTEVDIDDSYFYYNRANTRGGAIFISSYSFERVDINNSTFDYNGRSSDNGGAIYKESSGDTLVVHNSFFTRNGWSTTSGGAVYLQDTKAIFNNCEMTGNHASDNGSAIYHEGDWWDDNNEEYRNYIELNYCTITHNYNNSDNSSYSTNTSIRFENNKSSGIVNNSIINYNGETTEDDGNPQYIQFNNTITDNGHNDKLFINSHRDWREFDLAAHSPALGYGVYDERFPVDRLGNLRPNDGSNTDAGCYESARSVPESSSTTIYVSTDGNDETGSGEINNPYASVYKGVRASHYDWNDIIEIAPGTYSEEEIINLRGKRVHVRGTAGSNSTTLIFSQNRAFTHEDYSWNSSYPTGYYDQTLEGLEIKINPGTDAGIYMKEHPIHLIDLIIEDEIYSYNTSFNIDGLRSNTNEGFNNALIRLYGYGNEDYHYYFDNMEIETEDEIVYMYHDYNGSGRDMNVHVSNSVLRAGSSGNYDVFTSGCCDGNSSIENRIYIEDSMIEGDINHRGLYEFTADRTVFKNTRFDISRNYSNNSTDFHMENCVVDNGYFHSDSDGMVKNTIFFPSVEYQLYDGDQSQLEFQYCANIPEDAPQIGVYNISADPLFVDSSNENYNLMPASPCVNSANPDNDGDSNPWYVDTDDQDSDGTQLDMGVFAYDHYGSYEAHITSVDDVPDDQGGLVRINWLASPNDVLNGNITHYGVWRMNGDETLDALNLVPAALMGEYSFVATTVNDSVPTNPNMETFVVSAHTTDLEIFFNSASVSGYSIDNIAPSFPQGFQLSNNNNIVMLSWSANTEVDFDYYTIYRNDEKIADITETYFEELNFGELAYHITATDHNGNESEATLTHNIQLNLPGDVNLDDTVNVFDIVLMVEYILHEEESNFTALEFGLSDVNYDGELNILDIMHWVNVILGLARDDISMAKSAKLFIQKDALTHKADGLVGYHITLSHEPGIEITLTGAAILAEIVTQDNITEVIILNPGSEMLFTTNGDFEILNVLTASAENLISTDIIQVPNEFSLNPVYPNPFNPVTNISIDLPEETMLSVQVYDLNGRLVVNLVDRKLMDPGTKMIVWDASEHASGVYLVSVSAMESNLTQRITLLK